MKGWLSCVVIAGLAGFVLIMSEFSPGWAGCAVYVTPEQGTGVNTTSPDIFVAVVGGNGVVQYSFIDSNSSTSSTPFDTNGDTTDGDGSAHSTLNPFVASDLSSNFDLTITNGNNWPGLAGSGSTTFQPLPGSPSFATGADITCIRVVDGTTSDRDIWIIGRNGLGGVSRCAYDLDGDLDFVEKIMDATGDLDDDGWVGLTSQSPCKDVEQTAP